MKEKAIQPFKIKLSLSSLLLVFILPLDFLVVFFILSYYTEYKLNALIARGASAEKVKLNPCT